jgi:cyclophilin family peptidyl-prolyl cis-trans isomerase
MIQIEGRGDVYILLHTKEAPKTSAHILDLVHAGFYNGLRFHRVETTPKPYLVQIGDPASRNGDLTGHGGSGARIPYEESGFTNVEGAVGLSRPKNDREAGDSQFYILLDRASFLDGNYTVFGRVAAGMEVLRRVELGDRVVRASVLTSPVATR